MRLYVVRHGDAVSEKVDPTRPLSDEGRAAAQRVAMFLRQSGLRVARVLHSGKKRAEQTAEMLARSVGAIDHLQEMEGLKPGDPVDPVVKAIDEWTEDTMIVSHLPFVGNLVSQLVAGNEITPIVSFQAATIVCLARLENETWTILWVLSPDLLVNTGR